MTRKNYTNIPGKIGKFEEKKGKFEMMEVVMVGVSLKGTAHRTSLGKKPKSQSNLRRNHIVQ